MHIYGISFNCPRTIISTKYLAELMSKAIWCFSSLQFISLSQTNRVQCQTGFQLVRWSKEVEKDEVDNYGREELQWKSIALVNSTKMKHLIFGFSVFVVVLYGKAMHTWRGKQCLPHCSVTIAPSLLCTIGNTHITVFLREISDNPWKIFKAMPHNNSTW